MTARPAGARDDDSLVVSALWQAIRVLRPLALGYAAWSAWARSGDMQRPQVAGAVLCVIAAWSLLQFVRVRRDVATHLVELALASAAVLATRWVDTPAAAFQGTTTLPGVWQSVPVVTLGVISGWRGGVGAGLVIALCSVVSTGSLTLEPVSNGMLVVLLGGCVGYCADLARAEQRNLRRALEKKAEGPRARPAGEDGP